MDPGPDPLVERSGTILNPAPAVTSSCQHVKSCGGHVDIDWTGPGLFGYNLITTVIIGIALLFLLIFLTTRKGGWPTDPPRRR